MKNMLPVFCPDKPEKYLSASRWTKKLKLEVAELPKHNMAPRQASETASPKLITKLEDHNGKSQLFFPSYLKFLTI